MSKSKPMYFVYYDYVSGSNWPREGVIGTFEELTELFADEWWKTQECVEITLGKKK